jgi:hypothetical protein
LLLNLRKIALRNSILASSEIHISLSLERIRFVTVSEPFSSWKNFTPAAEGHGL